MGLPRDYLMVRCGSNLCCVQHINSELEVVCVKKGPFHIKFESHEMILKDNEATVILPYQLHGFSHGEGADVKIIMFSYSIAEDFYNHYKVMEMKRDRFILSSVLENYINQELFAAVESKNIFAIKSIFFPLISEYLKDNHGTECIKSGGGEVGDIINYVSERVEEGITSDDVSNAVGMSKQKISRIFKEYLGISFNEFLTVVRVEKAYNMVLYSDLSITDIAYKCGFGSLRNFNRIFLKHIKCTPSELRKNGGTQVHI